MKTLYLVTATNDGGKSDEIRRSLKDANVSFIERRFGQDRLPWNTISAVPCVVVDVDGTMVHAEEYRTRYDQARLLQMFATAPNTMQPKPLETKTSRVETAIAELKAEMDSRFRAIEDKLGITRIERL